MTRTSGVRSSAAAFARAVGAWLHPVSAFRPHSEPERQLQFRIGVVGLFCIVTGAITMIVAALALIPDFTTPSTCRR